MSHSAFVTAGTQREIIEKAKENKINANKKAAELESMMKVHF